MFDRHSKVGGFYVGDVGKDRVEVFDGQLQRHDWRWGVGGERRSDVCDLGESRMRIEGVERLKTHVPVIESFQERERRGGADGFHPVAVVDHVATTTVQHREFFAGEGVAFEDGLGLWDFLFAVGDEQQGVVRLVGFDGVAANLGGQPFAEFIAVLGTFAALGAKVPGVVRAGENRCVVAGSDQFRRCSFAGSDKGDADTVLQGETGQQMAEKTSVDQFGWRAKTKTAFLCETTERQQNEQENWNDQAGQILSSVGDESYGESVNSLGVAA